MNPGSPPDLPILDRFPISRLITVAILALLSVVLLMPIWSVLREGFQVDGEWSLLLFQDVFDYDLYREGLWNSFLIAGLVTLLCISVSIPLGLIADAYDFAGKRVWSVLILAPLVLPPFVGAIGIKGLLSRNGGVNALLASCGLIDPADPIDWLADPFWSCVVLEALYLYPITLLNIQASLAKIDPALIEAAQDLGAGPIRRFFRVTLPLLRPGIFAGSTIVFVWAFTELGTPLMVGMRNVTAVQVFDELLSQSPSGEVYALVTVLLACSLMAYAVGKFVLGRGQNALIARNIAERAPTRLGRRGAVLAGVPFAIVFMLAALPHLGVLLTSVSETGMIEASVDRMTLSHHAEIVRNLTASEAVGQAMAGPSIVNSMKYSVLATLADLVLGFGIAYLVVRRPGKLTGVMDNLAMLPLAVPGLVFAFGYFAMTQSGWLSFMNPLTEDPTPLLVMAYSVRRLPFLVRSCAAGLEQTSATLEEAAFDLGAGTPRTLGRITIPLILPSLIAGGLLVFSRSMLEVSDSLILAFNAEDYPMAKAIWALADIPDTGSQAACALGVWGMVLLFVCIVSATQLLGRRSGALFRI
jgi:iron(III) transport system permease protein